MAIFPQLDENAIFLSRTDTAELLSTYSRHPFFLDDKEWPSVAHYFHALKFEDPDYQEKIRKAPHPKKAKALGRSRLKRIRKDWKDVRVTVMTRAVYTKCRTHQDVAEKLLETGDNDIIENNAYDYYWGCGRDRRGENWYGKVLMNVRNKLREEQKEEK
jgi:ribA/ribD-fused uncharacterized protein